MARFDVFRLAEGTLVIDCQADLLDGLNTRVVAPLIPLEGAPTPAKRLNPIFSVEGRDHVLLTQFVATVELRELREKIGTLIEHELEVGNALDMLFSGF
jgi:toxin CcdB